MTTRDRGLVLRTYPLRETSKIVSLFCRTSGRVRLVARGVRAPRSRAGAGLETGNEIDCLFDLKPGRELGSLRESSLHRAWLAGCRRLDVLGLGFAVLELLDRQVPEGAVEPDLLHDALEALAALRAGAGRGAAVEAFYAFEIRLLARTGVLPDLEACCDCGSRPADGASLDVAAGGLRCRRCRRGGAGRIDLGPEVVDLFRALAEPWGGIAEGRASEPGTRRQLGLCLHRLLGAHLERYRYPRSLGLLPKEDRSRASAAPAETRAQPQPPPATTS